MWYAEINGTIVPSISIQAFLSTYHSLGFKLTSTMSLENKPNERITEVEKVPDVALSSDDALLQAQGHRAELKRSFSWAGAIGFAFRSSFLPLLIESHWQWQYFQCVAGICCDYRTCLTVWRRTDSSIRVCRCGSGHDDCLSGPGWIILRVSFIRGGYLPAFPLKSIKRCQGQYHYTYIMAPGYIRNFLAFLVGICNILGWWMALASGTIIVAKSTFGLVLFRYPDFEQQQWQVYLCYILTIVLSCKYLHLSFYDPPWLWISDPCVFHPPEARGQLS